MSRPFLSFVQFAYPNAKFEAMGNPFIHSSILEKVMESETLDEFVDSVNTYKDYQLEGSTAAEVQESLQDHLIVFLNSMKRDHGKKMKEFFDVYIEEKNAFILKEILRSLHKNEPVDTERLSGLVIQSPRIHKFIEDIQNASEESLPEVLSSFGFDKTVLELLSSEDTVPLRFDVFIDAYYLHKMESVKVPYNCRDALHEFIARRIDMVAMKHMIRATHMQYHEKLCTVLFIGEGFEIGSWRYQEFCKADSVDELIESLEGTSYYQALKNASEKQDIKKSVQPLITALDRQMLEMMKNMSQQYYVSIGPTLRFLVSKEAEVMNLKIISKGVSEQLSSANIIPLLVMEENL